jgi:hypothetical protein|tara:strand:- start:322 stop:522 length:201 start_codon:yes stop_codon:yes gene_type:complete
VAQIDTIGLLTKAYKKADSIRKRFTSEYQNFAIDRYNTKNKTNIPKMKSEYDLKAEAANKKNNKAR